ncbi:MAG: roadblock/LC7 domain-containing protein [Candidatus Hermodarchaeota archaeon]
MKNEKKNFTNNFIGILEDLLRAIPDIKSTGIVSIEGLPIASIINNAINEVIIAAMTAAHLSLAERSIIEMKNGEFDQLWIEGSDGQMVILKAGENAVLMISATNKVRVGLIIFEGKRACKKIADLL